MNFDIDRKPSRQSECIVLAKLEQARAALAEARNIYEAKAVRDTARAAAEASTRSRKRMPHLGITDTTAAPGRARSSQGPLGR